MTENTYIFDPESANELARLITQSHFFIEMCGGPLAGIEERPNIRTILDLGCGPGGWVLDVAFARPKSEVAGIDISKAMVDYANARALSQQLTNASFGVMNITEPLDFSDETFDYVHMTLLFAVLKRHQWLPYLKECRRILAPGGLFQSIEFVHTVSNSPALQREYDLVAQYLFDTGYGFSSTGSTVGVATALPQVLRRLGFTNIRQKAYLQDFSQGSAMWANFYRNQEVMSTMLLPLFVKRDMLTQEDADALHRQLMLEIISDDFTCTGYCHGVEAEK